MDKKETGLQDDRFRAVFSGTKIKTGVNLKSRIMQQVATESVLSRKKSGSKNLVPLVGHLISVLGVMYALIALIAACIYFTEGMESLQSRLFLIPAIMVASICGLFLVISVLDDKRRGRAAQMNKRFPAG